MAFRKAGQRKLGGKFLVFGGTGSGKSYFMLTFPGIAAVDSETGLATYEENPIEIDGKQYNNLLHVDPTSDIETLVENLEEAIDGNVEGLQTFGIDSETKFYNALQVGAMEVEERRARKKGEDVDDATVSQRQWGKIKLRTMHIQQMKLDLSARGIHVVSVAQQADLRDRKNTDKVVGEKPDMHKSSPYDYDTILHFYKETAKDGTEEFFAKVLKDRTGVTKPGQVIQNCTYDVWKPYFEGRSSLKTAETSYRKDIGTTTESMADSAENAEDLVADWKTLMKELKDAKNTEAIGKVQAKMKEMKVDIKTISLQPEKTVQELYDFTQAVAA